MNTVMYMHIINWVFELSFLDAKLLGVICINLILKCTVIFLVKSWNKVQQINYPMCQNVLKICKLNIIQLCGFVIILLSTKKSNYKMFRWLHLNWRTISDRTNRQSWAVKLTPPPSPTFIHPSIILGLNIIIIDKCRLIL